jgi:hypothetical protein
LDLIHNISECQHAASGGFRAKQKSFESGIAYSERFSCRGNPSKANEGTGLRGASSCVDAQRDPRPLPVLVAAANPG